MAHERNIFLIGPRAGGKTSVGQALAERLGREFVDTDHALVADAGMEIADYVARHGWDAFRDLEAEILARAATPGGRVIGCGGGIVLRKENRAVLRTGVTLYLKVDPDELARRLMRDPNEAQRPSLTGRSVADEVREVLAKRAPLYEGCADATVTGVSVDETVRRALDALDGHF
ncbi:MAG: shikimate kinase AroL [Desulfovibrionaceae bacterium]|nr:shikimate kinase AroL [Desulfovibrionaceae bacterium]